eukprot:12937076-Prorocentrum_lima.AAC.1
MGLAPAPAAMGMYGLFTFEVVNALSSLAVSLTSPNMVMMDGETSSMCNGGLNCGSVTWFNHTCIKMLSL